MTQFHFIKFSCRKKTGVVHDYNKHKLHKKMCAKLTASFMVQYGFIRHRRLSEHKEKLILKICLGKHLYNYNMNHEQNDIIRVGIIAVYVCVHVQLCYTVFIQITYYTYVESQKKCCLSWDPSATTDNNRDRMKLNYCFGEVCSIL